MQKHHFFSLQKSFITIVLHGGLFFLSGMLFLSCQEKREAHFDAAVFSLSEKTLILNKELDNSIEGHYLMVTGGEKETLYIENLKGIDFQKYVRDTSWVLGWGSGIPYFDAGNENIRAIASYDASKGRVTLGKLLRGVGYPAKGVQVTLLNRNPSGYLKMEKKPLIDCFSGWKDFSGKCLMFGKIIKDTVENQWVMYVNETDTPSVQVYAAVSKDLLHWEPAQNGMPIFTPKAFQNISWASQNAGKKKWRGPVITDVLYENNEWYLFLDGYNPKGERAIGMAKTKDPIKGPFEMIASPLLSAGAQGEWDEGGCFYPKVVKYKNQYLMFYDGYNEKGIEKLGLALSTDLYHWKKYGSQPVLNGHQGWRSSFSSSEVANVSVKKDSIFLFLSGAKAYKNNLLGRLTASRFKDVPGNVNDNQLGCYLSTDGGKHFISHANNPLFINDYADPYENDHLGASLEFFKKDGFFYLFYVAKTDADALAYHPFVRIKKIE